MHIHNKQELCRDIADAFSFVRFLIKHPKMLNKIKNNAHIHILPAKYKKKISFSGLKNNSQLFSSETIFHQL